MSMSEESSDEEENTDDEFDIDQETLTKLVETNPDLLNEFFSRQGMDDNETEYDENNQIEYLRKFCDWKKYLNTKELLEDEDEIVDDKLFSNNSTDSNTKFVSILSNDILHELSPLMVLELLIIEKRMEKKQNNINIKSQKEKLEILIKDGVNALKHKLYKNKVRYFDSNLLKINNSEQQIFSDAINLSLKLYHKFLFKLNIKNNINNVIFNKSYSVIDLIQKYQHQNECNKLFKIFNDNNKYLFIPKSIISVIAQYSFVIYAKCINKSSVHFCYNSLMLNKEIYQSLWFIKNEKQRKNNEDKRKEWKIGSKLEIYSCSGAIWNEGKVIRIFTDNIGEWMEIEYYVNNEKRRKEVKRYDHDTIRIITEDTDKSIKYDTMYFQTTTEIAELIHIFQPRHCDPRYISERKVGKMDYLLYYNLIDTYCIISSHGVELIGLELPDYLKPITAK